jgi:site-specific recombinase XerD
MVNLSTKILFFSMTFDFLEIYLTKQLGKSLNTVKNYKDSLTLFRRYVLEHLGISIHNFTFEQCTRELIMNFLDYLVDNGSSKSTRNQRLSAIRSYLLYASQRDISLQSIYLSARTIKQANITQIIRPLLSIEQIKAILSKPDLKTNRGIRDCTILSLLYDSAVRVSEVLELKIDNISLKGNDSYIRVMGKGSKERLVSICDNTSELIKYYCCQVRDRQGPDTNLLFYTIIKGKAGRISSRNVELMLQKYANLARCICPDIPKKVYPHMLRRSRATHMYQSGVALPLVSRVLGHTNIVTTTIYAIPSLEMMKNAMSAVTFFDTSEELPTWDTEDDMAKKSGLR